MYQKGDKVKYVSDIHWNNNFFKDYREFKGIFEVIDSSHHNGQYHVFIKSIYNNERSETKETRGINISGRYWCMDPIDFEFVESKHDSFNKEIDLLFEL